MHRSCSSTFWRCGGDEKGGNKQIMYVVSNSYVILNSRRCPRGAATAIAIGIVGRYPYQCCCHHRCRSSCRRLRCLRCRCPDVSVAPDAPATPPLPPSFVTDPTSVRLRLATVPRQRRRRRRRRSATDATAPTPNAAWMTPSSAWPTGSSSARSSRQRHRGAAAAESGDRNNVNACDQHRRVVHWAGGSGGRGRQRRRNGG